MKALDSIYKPNYIIILFVVQCQTQASKSELFKQDRNEESIINLFLFDIFRSKINKNNKLDNRL